MDQIIEKIISLSEGKIKGLVDNIKYTTISETTGLVTIASTEHIKINFMPTGVKFNTSLGWYLGFRGITGNTLASADSNHTFIYDFQTSITGAAIAMVPKIKYFVVVVDDFNKTQTSDTLVQVQLDPLISSTTSYFTQDPYLDYLTPSNINTYLDKNSFPKITLTKSQVYTRAQQNQAKNSLQFQNQRLDVHNPNQILAVYPFDGAKLNWKDNYFSDKCKYKREYHSPTNLERLHIKLYDDTGFLINLNGNNWYMTLMTENVYKY